MTDRYLETLRAERPWAKPITENEKAWIEFIRLASYDTDPAPTLETVQALRQIFTPHLARSGRHQA